MAYLRVTATHMPETKAKEIVALWTNERILFDTGEYQI